MSNVKIGDAGDSLGRHNNMRFTTKDVDNDPCIYFNCADVCKGGWWYFCCHKTNLNGYYYEGNQTAKSNGIIWYDWKGYQYSLKATEIKIRPVRF